MHASNKHSSTSGVSVTVGNLKGGTGKSTTSVYLALALAKRGGRVLLVDADDANATAYSWVEMAGEEWPSNIIVQRWPTLHVGRLVSENKDTFDHVVIDTGRDAAVLRSALHVTDLFLLPMAPTMPEVARLQDTLDAASEVGAVKELDLAILLTKARAGTRSARDVRAHLSSDLELPVFETEIPLAERYAQSMGSVPPLGFYGSVLSEVIARKEAQ